MTSLTLTAPAKLNLFLCINGRRDDGYHDLQTLYQLIDWSDRLTLTRKTSGTGEFSCSNKALETADNLVVKALRRLEQTLGRQLPVRIHLHKRLPIGGGLGGGSSNGATTLLGLNRLFKLGLKQSQLLLLARELGADVPLFILGKTAWAEGIGDLLTPMATPDCYFVVLDPGLHVATAELFAAAELSRGSHRLPMSLAATTAGNAFEPLVRARYPAIDALFRLAEKFGKPQLTGSGGCLFLPSSSQASAQRLLNQLQAAAPGLAGVVARGIATTALA